MRFDVYNRYTSYVQFTAEIDCDESASMSIKLGLAVKWAIIHKANLSWANLAGADLSRADLSRANLAGADLSRADLSRANLSWANLSWANLSWANLIVGGQRSDGWQFFAIREKKGSVKIRAGVCRYFNFMEAREHWTKTRGGTRLGDESLAIVDHLERMVKIAGWIK